MTEKAPNNVRVLREERMMSRAELARKAGLSALTVARIEDGMGCRMETRRKLMRGLGLELADYEKVFPNAGGASTSGAS